MATLMGLRPGIGPKRSKWKWELARWERERDDERQRDSRRLDGPRQTERIFKGDKRKHVISVFMDLMQDWQWTPFENEGPTRAGIREALCLAGYGWQRADDEASEILRECLKSVPRPKWIEGQWQYTIPRENCQRCYRRIDDEDYIKGSRYCSPTCSEASRIHSAAFHEMAAGRQRAIATFHAWREAQPKQTCQRPGCGKKFKPSMEDQKYCSRECRGLERRTVERRICENPECGNEFPHYNHRQDKPGLWCSPACFQKRRRVNKAPVQCACDGCPNTFQPIDAQKYCSERCRARESARRSRARKAAQSSHPISRLFEDAA